METIATTPKTKKIIIFAGMKSDNWEEEATMLEKILLKEGYQVLAIIPATELKRPQIEYLQ